MEGHLQRTLGENVRRIRQARGLSQEAFADALGVHRTYMGTLERGQRNMSLRAVERLAGLLGIDDPRTLLSETMTVSVTVTDPGR
ncbi:helix-turn-helix domain-containing protein [Nocardia vermiculata]|uniref:Helix-turn-helix transcriptional regulator n=1 Tax=Nocardia vermiculata TaxID=257274 RepID=A0A846XXT6_9NOCA|nr:helix-turn-helix transcriptional regulator [Nocardia vermiculata]NKY50181.1 helix-turn-helix transcriptional regulator [Nocardia vermiculata]